MEFHGIDRVVFGVESLTDSEKFLTDWGLAPMPCGPGQLRFETQDGTEIVVRPASDSVLPPAIESGPTVREVIWGVEDDATLQALVARLARHKSFAAGADGTLRVIDPMGLAIGFRKTRRRPVHVMAAQMNTPSNIVRIDRSAPIYERAQPINIGHVVLFTHEFEAMEKFYTEVLEFKVSDRYPGYGLFLRCRTRGGHHNFFLLKRDKPGLNHVAFVVRDIHEVFGGGMHMSRRGWNTQLGPGRHPISSAYFWYFHNPLGGALEYYCDEDFVTENWRPRDWKRSPENFAEWAITGGLDGTTRRQKQGPTIDERTAAAQRDQKAEAQR